MRAPRGRTAKLVVALAVVATIAQAQITVTGLGGFPNGTASLPAIFFSGDPDTGFYNYGANVIGWSSGGAVKGVLSGNVSLTNTGLHGWASAGDPGALDTAWGRSSAGVAKLTDSGAGIRGLFGGGSAVASAAALPLPTGRVFHVTGTTTITSITSTNFQSGVCITMIFDGVLSITDSAGLNIGAAFTSSADDTLSMCFDGTNWYEIGRSVN